MAGKRVNLAELADEPPLDARVPAFADTNASRAVRVGQVAANPLNTRDVQAAKISSIADSIRAHGQLQPCTVVARAAFLAIFPEHEQSIGTATYVQVTGGRRLAAVIEAGIPTLDITVKNGLAESRALFVSATAAENLDREDYDPIEEAHAVQLLVQECGTGKAAAEQLSRTPPWVTQRLNLLKLAPAVQVALRSGDIPLREVRDLHKLSAEEQVTALTAWQERRSSPELTAVNSGEAEGEAKPAGDTRLPTQRPSPVTAAIRKLGNTPTQIAANLRSQLSPQDLKTLAEELLRDA